MSAAQRQITRCLPLLQEQCTVSKLHSAKLVRLRMLTAALLLDRDPSIKIIHLLRDPRGILNSRHQDARNQNAAMVQDSKVLCPTIVRDLFESQEVQKKYPDSVLMLKYEDVASDPLTSLDTIYTHLRLATPDSVKKWFNSTMKHGESKSGGSSTKKKNPESIAIKWQSAMEKHTIEEINKNCEEAITLSGYTL